MLQTSLLVLFSLQFNSSGVIISSPLPLKATILYNFTQTKIFYTSAASAASNKYHDWIHLVDEMSLCNGNGSKWKSSEALMLGVNPKLSERRSSDRNTPYVPIDVGGENFEPEKNVLIDVGVKLDEST